MSFWSALFGRRPVAAGSHQSKFREQLERNRQVSERVVESSKRSSQRADSAARDAIVILRGQTAAEDDKCEKS